MKINAMTSALALTIGALTAGSAIAATENSAGGRVTFEGLVTEVSCTISVDGQAADATVTLAPVSVTEVDAANTLYKSAPFNIYVSDCEEAGSGIIWEGGNRLANPGTGQENWLANILAPQGGSNINLALAKEASSDFITFGENNTNGTEIDEESYRYTYYVGYITGEPDGVVPGPVQSYATFAVNYN